MNLGSRGIMAWNIIISAAGRKPLDPVLVGTSVRGFHNAFGEHTADCACRTTIGGVRDESYTRPVWAYIEALGRWL